MSPPDVAKNRHRLPRVTSRARALTSGHRDGHAHAGEMVANHDRELLA
jgi:hypothetical protein